MRSLSERLDDAIEVTADVYVRANNGEQFGTMPEALNKAEALAAIATAHMSLEAAKRLLDSQCDAVSVARMPEVGERMPVIRCRLARGHTGDHYPES